MISFTNERTGEVVTFDSNSDHSARASQITGYINSSNLGPNSDRGQDFGWRLDPELVVRIEKMRREPQTRDLLSARLGVPADELLVAHYLNHIISLDDAEARSQLVIEEENNPHKKAYEAKLAELRNPTEVPKSK